MNTVLRATDSADFLGIVPALAGFTPRQSIVLLPFHRSRAHGAMRIDLPRDDVDIDDYVDAAIGLVGRVSGIDGIAVVVYTDELPQYTPDGTILPQTVVVEDLLALAVDFGLHLVDALCVTPCGWGSYFDDDPELHPLDEIPETPTAPGLGDVSGDQDAGTALPSVDLAEKQRVGRALLDLTSVISHEGMPDHGRQNPQAIAAATLLDDVSLLFESVLERPVGTPPFVAAALLWCLDRPTFRDAALMQWATDLPTGVRALDAQLAFVDEGTSVPPDIGGMLVGQGPAPDPDRLRLTLALARDLAARAPRASRPGPLLVAAWMSWALGRSTHAAHYLDEVIEIEPEYTMAHLMRHLIDGAVLPEWTFRRGGEYDFGG